MRTLGFVFLVLLLGQCGCYSASEYRGPGGLSRYPVTHSWAKYLLVLPPLPAGDAETVFSMSGLPSEDFRARIESQQSLAALGKTRLPQAPLSVKVEIWDERETRVLSIDFRWNGTSWEPPSSDGRFSAMRGGSYRVRVRSRGVEQPDDPKAQLRPCFTVYAPVWSM